MDCSDNAQQQCTQPTNTAASVWVAERLAAEIRAASGDALNDAYIHEKRAIDAEAVSAKESKKALYAVHNRCVRRANNAKMAAEVASNKAVLSANAAAKAAAKAEALVSTARTKFETPAESLLHTVEKVARAARATATRAAEAAERAAKNAREAAAAPAAAKASLEALEAERAVQRRADFMKKVLPEGSKLCFQHGFGCINNCGKSSVEFLEGMVKR